MENTQAEDPNPIISHVRFMIRLHIKSQWRPECAQDPRLFIADTRAVAQLSYKMMSSHELNLDHCRGVQNMLFITNLSGHERHCFISSFHGGRRACTKESMLRNADYHTGVQSLMRVLFLVYPFDASSHRYLYALSPFHVAGLTQI